jgi:hypothetical protein
MPASTAPNGAPQAGESEDPSNGTEVTPQDGAEGSSSTEGITDVAVLQRELSKARAEAAKYRVESKAFAKAKADEEAAALTESQRLTRRVAELEKENELATKLARAKTLEAAVAKQAQLLGIIDPDAAVKLLDTDDLELDDETGEPKNIEVALKALIKAKPYLAGKASPETPGSINGAAGAAAGPAPKLTAAELETAQAAGMTPERFAALKEVKSLDDWKKTLPAKT